MEDLVYKNRLNTSLFYIFKKTLILITRFYLTFNRNAVCFAFSRYSWCNLGQSVDYCIHLRDLRDLREKFSTCLSDISEISDLACQDLFNGIAFFFRKRIHLRKGMFYLGFEIPAGHLA